MKNSIKTLIAACIMLSLFSTLLISCEKEPAQAEEENDDTPSNDLIAYWAFDENGVDSSGNGHTATLNNVTPTTDRFGKPKGAYYFNGTNSYASVADKAPLRLSNTDFTLNAWVKLDQYHPLYASSILSKRVSGYNQGWLSAVTGYSNTPSMVMYYGPGSDITNAYGGKVVGLSDWHMVTTVYQKAIGSLSIYVDGVLDKTTNGLQPINGDITAMLYIGKDGATGSYYLKGALDDIKIYGKAFNSTEIKQFYDTSKGQSNDLIAYWPFNGDGSDLSGNNHTATLNNLTSTTDRFGNPKGAYYFNGTNSYASVADKAPLRLSNIDFTLNAWVKLDEYHPSYASSIISKRVSGYNQGWLSAITGLSNTPSRVMYYGPGSDITNAYGSKVINLSGWHMVTTVYKKSAGSVSIYIDGILDKTTNGVQPINGNITAMLYIGKDEATSSYYLKGALDDIKIYGKALNTAEVLQFYNNTRALANGEEG